MQIPMDEFKQKLRGILAEGHPEINEPLVFKPEPAQSKYAGEPYDPGCGNYASQLPGVVMYAEDAGMSPADYVRREEGTYNPESNHFLCDMCYIQAGQPTSPAGWKCP